jgi:hypothetical protein
MQLEFLWTVVSFIMMQSIFRVESETFPNHFKRKTSTLKRKKCFTAHRMCKCFREMCKQLPQNKISVSFLTMCLCPLASTAQAWSPEEKAWSKRQQPVDPALSVSLGWLVEASMVCAPILLQFSTWSTQPNFHFTRMTFWRAKHFKSNKLPL